LRKIWALRDYARKNKKGMTGLREKEGKRKGYSNKNKPKSAYRTKSTLSKGKKMGHASIPWVKES